MADTVHYKENQVKDLIDANEHLPLQGTDKWLEEKRFTIGGSSLYTAVHTLSSYLNNQSFNGNLYTEWGNIFEPVIEHYTERVLFTKLYGTSIGSIPHKTIPGFAYSMDGIGVVKNKIILFEFKCPWSRLPTSKIPIKYDYQVKAGLDTFDIAEKGIYAEAVFRACSLQDLYNNTNSSLHKEDIYKKKPRYTKPPLGHGLLCFYSPSSMNSSKYTHHVFKGKEDGVDIIYQHKDKLVRIYETPMILPENEGDIDSDQDMLNLAMGISPKKKAKHDSVYKQISKFAVFCHKHGHINVGIMPYKLYEYNVIIVKKEKGFLKKYEKEISKAVELKTEMYKDYVDTSLDLFNLAITDG